MVQITRRAKLPLRVASSPASWELQSRLPPHPDVDEQQKERGL